MSDDADRMRDAVSRYRHLNRATADPDELLSAVIEACDAAADDDDELCNIAVVLIDGLLDQYWHRIGDRFQLEMAAHQPLRKAYSCTMTDIPNSLRNRLDALVGPDEDIGHNK